MKVESIAIVGTGVIGSSWAAFFAAKGIQVKLWDVDADLCQKGQQRAVDILRQLQTEEILSGDDVEEAILVNGGLAVEFDGQAEAVVEADGDDLQGPTVGNSGLAPD